ncbi:MAG: asparagine synthase (glutamine-hydrolyzing) [Chlorobi bacterium]|nr:asparagine synthase (glutamine-hydrolyzing) [Chlorobiota bacterium]
MCGIAGLVKCGSSAVLQKMVSVQAHRGPDDTGSYWFQDQYVGLGHRRLSILDLSKAGHQPMKNSMDDSWIVFNGEIYNYPQLREELKSKGYTFSSDTDTEIILASYDCWGEDCVKRLNGMFAFAIYNPTTQVLFLARDHFGIKPLYYWHSGEKFAFASEAKALFEVKNIAPIIDQDSVISSLLFLWTPEPKSGFRDIHKFPAGHYGIFTNGIFQLHQYWDVPLIAEKEKPCRREDDLVDELRSILEKAVQRQMLADVPVGAFLSGGLDSSLIVALMRKVSNADISTYTIAFSEDDKRMEAMPDDARYARIVSKICNTTHHEILATHDFNHLLPKLLWHLDEPIADGAAINTYLISHGAKQRGTTVLLNGMGGDEVYGGYRKQLAALFIQQYHRLPRWLRTGIVHPVVNRLPVAIGGKGVRLARWAQKFVRSAERPPLDAFMFGFAYFNPDELHQLLSQDLSSIPFDDLYPIQRYKQIAVSAQHCSFIDTMLYLDTKLFLPGLNLAYSDKASMAASVESRPPLLDVELVEFMARVPSRLKIHGRTQKYLLKRAAEAYLPREIIYRPKAAFGTPIRAWMRGWLGQEARRVFTHPDFAAANYIRADFPLRLLEEHIAGKRDHAHRLWGIYTVMMWLQAQSQRMDSKT